MWNSDSCDTKTISSSGRPASSASSAQRPCTCAGGGDESEPRAPTHPSDAHDATSPLSPPPGLVPRSPRRRRLDARADGGPQRVLLRQVAHVRRRKLRGERRRRRPRVGGAVDDLAAAPCATKAAPSAICAAKASPAVRSARGGDHHEVGARQRARAAAAEPATCAGRAQAAPGGGGGGRGVGSLPAAPRYGTIGACSVARASPARSAAAASSGVGIAELAIELRRRADLARRRRRNSARCARLARHSRTVS